MSLQTALPEELLALVFSEFDPTNDQSTIAALRLTNMTCCRLVTSSLRRVVNASMATPGNPDAVSSAQQVGNDLLENSQLAQFVKEMNVKQSGGSTLWQREKDTRPSYVTGSDSSTSSLPKELEQEIRKAVTTGAASGCIAFILATCGKLEVLRFSLGVNAVGNLVSGVLNFATKSHLEIRLNPQKALNEFNMLGSVRDLSLGDSAYVTTLADALNLLCLPRLRHLSILGLANNPRFSDRTLPKTDNITRNDNPVTFTLESCMVSGEGLGRLLAACSNPKSLTVHWRIGDWNKGLTNEPIGESIREHGRKLEYVHLNTADMYNWRHDPNPTSIFGSFASLKARTLVVPTFTCDVRSPQSMDGNLPSGLEELYLLGVESGEEGPYVRFQESTRLPKLKKVVCVPWLHYEFYEWFGKVHSKCVDFDLVGGFSLRNIHKRE